MRDLRIEECRAAAHKPLKDLMVAAPDEIDLNTMAWRLGRLRIEEGGLDTAEGRIVVPSKNGGTIRVKAGLSVGRRRFTIAHEIGHFILHSREGLEKNDTAANFTIWNDPDEETEANFFAAELLMPEFLFKPRSRGPVPSLALIDTLSVFIRVHPWLNSWRFSLPAPRGLIPAWRICSSNRFNLSTRPALFSPK